MMQVRDIQVRVCPFLPVTPKPANQSVVTAQHQEEQSALRNQLAPGIIKIKARGPHPREVTSLRKYTSLKTAEKWGQSLGGNNTL